MTRKVLERSKSVKRARIRRTLRSKPVKEAKEAIPCEKKKGQYYVPESSSGFYTLEQIKDDSAILDLHESWYEREPLPKKRGRKKSADDLPKETKGAVLGVEKKRYGSCEVEEISDLAFIDTDDGGEKREPLEELVCGFGGHEIEKYLSPIQVRSSGRISYVCPSCSDKVPKEMFVKKLETAVSELCERGERQNSMSALGYKEDKYASLKETLAYWEPIVRPVKNMLSGFSVGPYHLFAFSSAIARSGKGIDRYTLSYGLGKAAGALAATAGAVTCAVGAFSGFPEAAGLIVALNALSAGYELSKEKKFDPQTVESAYCGVRDFLYLAGYEVARRNHTDKFPYGVVAVVESEAQLDELKVQLVEIMSSHKVKPRFNIPSIETKRKIVNIGLTPLIARKY